MSKVSRLELIASGARRRWTLEEKQRIIAESLSGHRAASATARRYGLSSSQLFAWRKLAREGRLSSNDEAGFVAALVIPSGTSEATLPTHTVGPGRMEIVIGETRVIVDASVDTAALGRVLDILERR